MKFLRRYPVLKTVVVVTKAGESFHGLYWKNRGNFLVLRQVQMYADGGAKPLPVDGEVAIPRHNVDYIQVV